MCIDAVDPPRVTMADPEGNEFDVLEPLPPGS